MTSLDVRPSRLGNSEGCGCHLLVHQQNTDVVRAIRAGRCFVKVSLPLYQASTLLRGRIQLISQGQSLRHSQRVPRRTLKCSSPSFGRSSSRQRQTLSSTHIPDESRGGVLTEAFARRSVEASGPFQDLANVGRELAAAFSAGMHRCTIWRWGTLESAL